MPLMKEKEPLQKVRISSVSTDGVKPEQGKKKKIKMKKKSPEPIVPLKKDLVNRLQHLRSVAREVTSSYLANLERNILEVIDHLNGVGKESGRSQFQNSRAVKAMIQKLDQLSVKPEKGRRKDLKRLERIVEMMMEALP